MVHSNGKALPGDDARPPGIALDESTEYSLTYYDPAFSVENDEV
jgi:hypothetical protein